MNTMKEKLLSASSSVSFTSLPCLYISRIDGDDNLIDNKGKSLIPDAVNLQQIGVNFMFLGVTDKIKAVRHVQIMTV